MYLENQCLPWVSNFYTCKKHNWIVTDDKMRNLETHHFKFSLQRGCHVLKGTTMKIYTKHPLF